MQKITSLISISFFYLLCQISLAATQEDYTKCDIPKNNYGILTKKNTTNCAYMQWQCFPVEDVTLTLEEIGTGFLIDGIEPMGHAGDVTIIAYVNKKNDADDYQIRHEYGLRKRFPIESAEYIFHGLQKLLKKQEYVCLAGGFVSEEKDTYRKQDVSGWIFEKMRTKRGCYSWFEGGCKS